MPLEPGARMHTPTWLAFRQSQDGQAVERRLGPTPSAEDLEGDLAEGVAPWEPTVYTDGRLEHGHPWAPWMALGAFAVWAPGRTEER